MNFKFYDEREKHTKDTKLKIFRSNAPCFWKFWRENTKEHQNLKILRSKHKEDSRTLWRFTRTTRTTERTPNLKFLENFNKIFENYKKINKKTPNLKFGTRFNQRKIIFEKDFKKKIPNHQEHQPTL